jgi:protein involved in polysaccharide export with SLBB domain
MLMGGFTVGCAHNAQQRASVERNLMDDRETTTRNESVLAHYQVGCPDVLTIELANAPGVRIRQVVGADGRIELASNVKPRVEGRSPEEIANLLASALGVSPESVDVRVAEYRSQQLFLFGQIVGWQRSVPYVGQETVLDLLQRVGGITPGAEPSDVYVVRAHIDEGGRPEVFHIDLQNIVTKHKQATNLRLLPNDQVYVGETRQARIERVIPPWMRPLYQVIWDTQPPQPSPISTMGK